MIFTQKQPFFYQWMALRDLLLTLYGMLEFFVFLLSIFLRLHPLTLQIDNQIIDSSADCKLNSQIQRFYP